MRAIKDSKIDTIGMVPSSWRQRRLKYLCRVQTGNEDTQNANPDGQYPFFVRSPIQERCDRYTFDGEGILVAGDGAGAGRIFHHAFGKYAVHQRVYRLSEFLFPSRFLFYWLSLLFPYEMDKGSAQSTVPSMRLPMLLNFSVFMPSKEEALSISSFLDSKCAEIDALMEDIRAEISTLEEYKKSVITEAVTKGLNPDAEMKDSGIAWVGEIPGHWEVKGNKYIMHKIKHIQPLYQGEDILSLSMKGVVVRDLEAGGKMPTSFDGYQILYPGNLLMCLFDYDVTPRCIGLIKNYGVSSPAYSQFVLDNRNNAAYYYYYYLMIDNEKSILHLAKNLRHSFTEEQLGGILAPVPPTEEQQAIADYLDAKCDEIAATIAEKQKQLTTLEEYKKSLIYEYVTGKKEVPTL